MRGIWQIAFVCGLPLLLEPGMPLQGVPTEVTSPSEEEVILETHASGFRIFVCEVGTNQRAAWKAKAVEAELRNEDGVVVASYSGGSHWRHIDGSEVTAVAAMSNDTVETGGVARLLFRATRHAGQGVLGAVTRIEQSNAKGDVPSPVRCNESNRGARVKESFSANFSFYGASPFTRSAIDKISPIAHGTTVGLDVSRDGKRLLLLVRDLEGADSIWVRNLEERSNTQIIPAKQNRKLSGASFAPDGGIYLSWAEPSDPVVSLYRAPISGGTPIRVIRDIDTDISFGPGGQRFAYAVANQPETGKFQLKIASADGTRQSVVRTGQMPMPNSVAWSPDGKQIVCSWNSGAKNGELTTIDLATGSERSIFPTQEWGISRAVWRPDGGGLIVLGANGSYGQQIGYFNYRTGKYRRITNDSSNYSFMALGNDGRTILTNSSTHISDIYVGDGKGEQLRQVTSREYIDGFNWTPEGKLVSGIHGALTLIDPATNSRTNLLGDGKHQVIVASACGSGSYAFSGLSPGNAGLRLWIWDRNGLKQLTTEQTVTQDVLQACSPDGKWAYFYRRTEKTNSVMKVSLTDGSAPVLITALTRVSDTFALSPDGKLIAFGTTSETSASKTAMAVVEVDGRKAPQILPMAQDLNGMLVRFTPDGQAVAFTNGGTTSGNIWLQPLDGSEARQLTHFDKEYIGEFAWSPDGQVLALTRGHWDFETILIREDARNH